MNVKLTLCCGHCFGSEDKDHGSSIVAEEEWCLNGDLGVRADMEKDQLF